MRLGSVMRGILLGGLAGLVIGISGTYAYEQYFGDGAQLAQTQAQLDAAKTSLAGTTTDSEQLKSENDALSAQVQQLSSRNDELKQQVEQVKENATANSGGSGAGNPVAGMMKASMEQQFEQKLLLLKSRLHLTPEQEATLKAAMDEELKEAEEMMAAGKFDTQALGSLPGAQALNKTLNDILTPEQKATLQQIQTDEKNNAVETVATFELNQLTPLLQLSDSQKDQVYSALAQVQANITDPNWVKNNLSGATDAASVLQAQANAKEQALVNILTPDQMAIFRQQVEQQLEEQKALVTKNSQGSGASPGP